MGINKERPPWVVCPVCWTPISFKDKKPGDKRECESSYCAMIGQKMSVHVFRDQAEAVDFANTTNLEVLQGPNRLYDFENQKLDRWMVATFEGDLDRLRLLDGMSLTKLLPREFINSWIGDASGAKRPDLFKVIAMKYVKDTGELELDKHSYPVIKEFGIEHVACPFRQLILKKLVKKRKENKNYPDPCYLCHQQLAWKVFEYARNNKGAMRLATSDVAQEISIEQMKELSDVCWTGLVSVALPILIFDVIAGVGVMMPRYMHTISLTQKQEDYRTKILNELNIKESEFLSINKESRGLPGMLCKDYEELKNKRYWKKFRVNINHFQNLAQSRYGQTLSVKLQILIERFQRRIHNIGIEEFSTEQQLWDNLGTEVFEELAHFFSFKDFRVFGRDDTDSIRLLASMTKSKLGVSNSKSIDVEGLSDDRIREKLLEEAGLKKEETVRRGSPIVVGIDHSFWYVFGNRKFANGKLRESFNAVCADLLYKSVKSLHAEIDRILVIHRNLDGVIGMAHNLKKPTAQLVNAQKYYNSVINGTNSVESMAVFGEDPWLKKATEVLYDSVSYARRKVEFEAKKLQYGRDISEILKDKQHIPIVGATRTASGEPISFWGKAIDSVKVFIGKEELSSLKMASYVDTAFIRSECVMTHPEEISLLLDNLSDNAAKYSFEKETVEIRLSRKSKDGNEYVVYSISNYGNGIDESERGKIGQKFYRGKYSTTANTQIEGTGLGVYTVKEIVKHLGGGWKWNSDFGGEVNVVPGEGYKTTFTIWLPIVLKKGTKGK